jgi:ABC-2 type transport system permease protein
MLTVTRHTLIRLRGQILGWGLGIASLGLIIVLFYGVFMDQQETLLQMIEAYPPEFLAFFGGDATSMTTPGGYLGMYGFSMLPVIGGIFAVIAGSGLLACDEESGRLDLLVSYPVGRTAFFAGRLLALLLATLGILLIGWVGFALPLFSSSLDVSAGSMALPFFSLLAQLALYGALALLLSLLLPARRYAAATAGAILVCDYLLGSLAGLNETLAEVAQLLPYHYFQGGEALEGLDLGSTLALLGVAALIALFAWWRFQRRDLRVAGEGSFPQFRYRFRRPAAADR